MKELKPEERLIVAADFKPERCEKFADVMKKILALADSIADTGVFIKVNSALRTAGYDLIHILHSQGLRVFADLKLIDIPKTMEIDAALLSEFEPEIVTVMACSGIDGMQAVQNIIGDKTEVLGVTVLTSLNEEECQAIFTCSTKAGVLKFARMAQHAKLGGLILSPKEIEVVKNRFELQLRLNTPGIRPKWSLVKNDDQNPERVLTPAKAIEAGVDRLVIGRPITQAKDPREAVLKTLDEIQEALAKKGE